MSRASRVWSVLVAGALAAAPLALAGCASPPHESLPAPATPTASVLTGSATDLVPSRSMNCRDPIGQDAPTKHDVTALGAVAFAYAAAPLQGDDSTGQYSTKVALKIDPAHPVTISSVTEGAYFYWGNYGSPVYAEKVTIDCSALSAKGRWLTYPGGVVTGGPGCLQVRATDRQGHTAMVSLGLGAKCPGASPRRVVT